MIRQTFFRWLPLAALPLLLAALAHAQFTPSPSNPMPLPADFPKGLPVTISGSSFPEILPQLSTQSSMQFSITRGNLNRQVVFRDIPLWEVVRMLQDQIGTDGIIQWRVGDGPLTQQVAPPFSNAGPFLIRVSSITHNADYGRPDPERYYLNVVVISDDSARLTSIQHASNPTRALDDAGNSLVPTIPTLTTSDMVPQRGGGQRTMEAVQIWLQRPNSPTAGGRTLKLLEGTLPVTYATKIDTLRLGFPANERRTYGNIEATITCQISKMGGANNMLEINVRFPRPAAMTDDEEWERTAKVFSATRVRLLGADGKPISTQAGGESTTTTNRTTTVLYPIPTDNSQPQVVVEIPAEYRSIGIPYHFENLPLP